MSRVSWRVGGEGRRKERSEGGRKEKGEYSAVLWQMKSQDAILKQKGNMLESVPSRMFS